MKWEVPIGTLFAGHNITARSRSTVTKDRARSYIDLGIPLRPGVLQAFQYYIDNPYGANRPQNINFQLWELRYQDFKGSTNQLLNSSIVLKYELEHTTGTQSGVYTVSFGVVFSMKGFNLSIN